MLSQEIEYPRNKKVKMKEVENEVVRLNTRLTKFLIKEYENENEKTIDAIG